MNPLLLIQICFKSILRNRMRSLLTSLGIIIGVGSVIIMVSLGEGSQKQIEAQIEAMGTNLLMVSGARVMMRPGQQITRSTRQITQSDAKKIKTESSYAAAVSGMSQRSFTVSGAAGSASVMVAGVGEDYPTIRGYELDSGTFFTDADGTERNRLAVLGPTTAETLFGTSADVIGQQFRIDSHIFTVIGVLKSKGSSGNGDDQDDLIMVPLETMLTRLTNSKNLQMIAISVVDKAYMSAAAAEITAIMREAHNISANGTDDFSIMNSADMLEMATSTSQSLTILLAAIAGVSLLVGGIGIMNIMLVSVTERTREIGIRMSVGARKRDILFQFLSESIILSLMGGLIGIGMAFLVCRVMSAMNIATSINPLIVTIAAAFAALVGIVFGYYPARKAAGLYPIDALRYE
ncbi:MAG: ABC transporter permease [Treponema sp.]|jgi:putative ABC transport system permease protein|nr:ABC transporter permease [Treponema sp.]